MNKIRSKLVDRISAAWCDWTHGGGYLWRDYLGRIYWRCAKCGRLSDDPVRETKAKKGLNRYSAKTLIDIAMARRDPEAARALYMLTSDKEPMFVEEYHQVCFKAQQIVDDLFDVMEWLRRDSLFAQADRVRTLLARLARSVPPHPCFGAWDSPGEVRDLARTFAEQLTVKESKAIIARAEAAEQKLAALEASQVKVPPSL